MQRIIRTLVVGHALACLALSVAAQVEATPARLAILSLVGDQISVVTFVPSTGSHLDTNRREGIAIPNRLLDRSVLSAALDAITAIDPSPVLLVASDQSLNDDQYMSIAQGKIALPASVVESVRAAGASKLILVTKRRATAQLTVSHGTIGNGKLQGLGFYVDGSKKLRRSDTGISGTGFIAPFFYATVSVVDVATLSVESTVPIQTGYALSSARNEQGVDAWGVLTAEQKIEALQRLIRKHLPTAVSKAVQESTLVR